MVGKMWEIYYIQHVAKVSNKYIRTIIIGYREGLELFMITSIFIHFIPFFRSTFYSFHPPIARNILDTKDLLSQIRFADSFQMLCSTALLLLYIGIHSDWDIRIEV